MRVGNVVEPFVLKQKDRLAYFEFPAITDLGWVTHAFLTRKGGVSGPPYDSLNLGDYGDDLEKVFRNRLRVAKTFDFDPTRLILLNQEHRDSILLVQDFKEASPPLNYDAIITNTPGLFLGIRTADCLPILMVDQKRKAVAAVHAGRQGTSLHIARKVLRRMREEFGSRPSDLLIAMGPSIGPCCYEIDERVFLPEWNSFAAANGNGKWMLDLGAINRAQMEEAGIKKEQILVVDLCTACRDDLFFSYRKEGGTGRQLSFIGIMK